MLYWIGESLTQLYGPFRLFRSHAILIIIGLYLGFAVTFILLPRVWRLLPLDQGRLHAAQATRSVGKPTGAGVVFISVFAVVSLLVVPMRAAQLAMLVMTVIVMLSGYLDDRSVTPWSEYRKGMIDLVLAGTAAVLLAGYNGLVIWLPFTNAIIELSFGLYVVLGTVILWTSINSTNCSDGVDGLSGSLVMLGLISLGVIMYFVVGHAAVSHYLLLPHNSAGAKWAVMTFTMVGCLAAYLWYNAYPSRVLMGDAGSRALGFFVGVSVMNSGNPFLIFLIASVLLVNGGAGLVKVALLRFLKVRVLHNTRFPLHDHLRESRSWSNAQVLVKLSIIQLLITFGLFGAFLKIR